MGGDIFTLVEQIKRSLDIVSAIADSCNYLKANLDYHIGTGADFDRMLNVLADAAETQELVDGLKAELDAYLDNHGHDISKLGLNSGQIKILKAFLITSDSKPFSSFAETYNDLGRPARIVAPMDMAN